MWSSCYGKDFFFTKSCDGGKEFAIKCFNNLTTITDRINFAQYFCGLEHAAWTKKPRGEPDNGNTNGYLVHQEKGVRNRPN